MANMVALSILSYDKSHIEKGLSAQVVIVVEKETAR